MKIIYMVVGCPASGKSWVCEQLRDRFQYVPHDASIGHDYIREIKRQAEIATKPLLIETPFSMSQYEGPLLSAGFKITPVFIQENPGVIEARYKAREGKPIPEVHLTRQRTYRARAIERNAFWASSETMLAYLKNAVPSPADTEAARKRYPWDL